MKRPLGRMFLAESGLVIALIILVSGCAYIRNFRRSGMLAIILVFGFLIAYPVIGVAAAPYCDPRVNLTCYKTWCSEQFNNCGEYYSDSSAVGCKRKIGCSSSSPSYYTPQNPLTGLFGALIGPIFQQAGRDLGCMLTGGCPDPNDAQREQLRQEELARQQAELARQQAEQAERQRLLQDLEQRDREQFQRIKERMLGEMRDMEVAHLRPRDLTGLQVEPSTGIFANTVLKPRPLDSTGTTSLAPRTIEAPAPMTAFQRAKCSAYLLKQANEAISSDKFEEAAYLSNEAANMMGSSSYRPGIECPAKVTEAPSVVGAPTPESQAMAESLRKQTLLYSKLLTSAAQQVADYRVATNSVEEGKKRVEEAKKAVEEAEKRKTEVETQQQQQPAQESQSAMAEALAALQQSQAALADAEKLLAEQQASMGEMEKQLQATRRMAEEAQQPGRTDVLLRRLGVDLSSKPE